ncbi:hypothetical protein B5P44_29890 [Mycobacterium sp. CBMA 213]|nr:hypothetical protein [Mycolicibacterium sp. CBMA 213]
MKRSQTDAYGGRDRLACFTTSRTSTALSISDVAVHEMVGVQAHADQSAGEVLVTYRRTRLL